MDNSVLLARIKKLCKKKDISIAYLESLLGMGNGSMSKWSTGASPSVNKIVKIAEFFNVSVDYLVGKSDIEVPAEEIIGDEDIIALQRARQKMAPREKSNMMQMVKLGFAHAFEDSEDDSV